MKKKYKKLHYGRLLFCIAVLVILLFVICFAVKSCITSVFGKKNNTSDKSSENKSSLSSDENSESKIEHIPAKTEYCFDYADITFTEEIDISAYETVSKSLEDIANGRLILVNNETEYIFNGNEETEFVQLNTVSNDSYYVKDNTVFIDRSVVEPLNEMMFDFETQVSKQINVISGYRSYEKQQSLYDEDLALSGNTTSTLVAMPGYSEHHMGLALDFSILINGESYSYDGVGEESWINENCYKYGFILRYLESKSDLTFIQYEPWHFRYIGFEHAYVVNYFDMCFEEYINMLKSYEFGKRHLGVNADGEMYEIYYVPSNGETTEVYVPSEREYEISGNNVDGFIVTVKL